MPNAAAKDAPESCVLVIYGASGDLTARKLIPALYQLDQQGRLPENLCVLGLARTEMTDIEWREHLRPWVERQAEGFNENHWSWFAGRLHYLAGSATDADLGSNAAPFSFGLLDSEDSAFVTVDKDTGIVLTAVVIDREKVSVFKAKNL